jgi:hypothetical protein
MVPSLQPDRARAGSRLSAALAVLVAVVAAVALLLPNPLADAFFAGWVLFGVALAVAGAVGAWTNRTALVGAAALLTTGLAVVGMWSIGFFVAPAALLLLASALLSRAAGPRRAVVEAITADPPSGRELALKAVAGVGNVILGGWLVNAGALERDLFGACAQETLACALAGTHWDAVAVTAVGLLLIGVGVWLVWRQLYTARVLVSRPVG